MYNNIRLEKGMYHLSGKSFTEALEYLDPSSLYADTPLAKLDAYERQLKRFDIRISGKNCDRVEKFFTSTENAVLFPEFIRRSIRQGIDCSVLSEISAIETRCSYSQHLYSNIDNANKVYSPTIKEYTRYIPYKTSCKQNIHTFKTELQCIGIKLGNEIAKDAAKVLISESGSATKIIKNTPLTYDDILTLYSMFEDFDLNTIIVSPTVATEILAMEQMMNTSGTTLPFGARILKISQIDNDVVIGIDKDFALEMMMFVDRLTDFVGDSTDKITLSTQVGFRPITNEAIHILELPTR